MQVGFTPASPPGKLLQVAGTLQTLGVTAGRGGRLGTESCSSAALNTLGVQGTGVKPVMVTREPSAGAHRGRGQPGLPRRALVVRREKGPVERGRLGSQASLAAASLPFCGGLAVTGPRWAAAPSFVKWAQSDLPRGDVLSECLRQGATLWTCTQSADARCSGGRKGCRGAGGMGTERSVPAGLGLGAAGGQLERQARQAGPFRWVSGARPPILTRLGRVPEQSRAFEKGHGAPLSQRV